VTEAAGILVVVLLAVPLVAAAFVPLARTPRVADRLNLAAATLTTVVGLALAALALAEAPGLAARSSWYQLDVAAGIFLAVIALVGMASAAASPAYLRHAGRSFVSARRSRALYYAALNVFWALLLAVPLTANLGVAWLLVEGTTAASALLVAFSGKRTALEAGWKYVVLTTLGLVVTLLGIVVLFASVGGEAALRDLDWTLLAERAAGMPHDAALVAFVLIMGGLAAKIGWAPVHNWLPDAHSEAPPPISAMLSAALLPTVLLVAWRTKLALEPAVGTGAAQGLLVGFGLISLAIAVPFLWRALPWKRLLAYSSLEHMGVLALGIGFGTPLAIAGVAIHVAGHGLAKSLGFYAAIPLLREDPASERGPARGVARYSPWTGVSMSVSLGTLAGLPPMPLFVSEVMILIGGIQAGLTWVAALAAVLLALGFMGLAHALLEGLLGERRGGRVQGSRAARPIGVLAGGTAIALVALSAVALALPDSPLVHGLMGGGG
jgi:hydrogenase-4 component F